MKRHRITFFSVLFWIVSVAFLIFVGYYIKIGIYDKSNEADSSEPNVKWYLTKNNIEVEPDDHSYYSIVAEENIISLYHEAELTAEDIRLSFKTSFADAEVFLNDKQVFSTKEEAGTQENIIFTLDAPSPKEHIVDFEKISQGDVIRIDVQLYYNDGTDGISAVMYGTAEKVSDALTATGLLGIVLCAALFGFGIIMLAIRFSSHSNVLTAGLQYIAFFAFFAAAFSLFNSQPICSEIGFSADVTYILHCLTFLVMFLPLILFFAESMTLRISKTVLLVDSVIQILCIGAVVALALAGIANLHTTQAYSKIIGIAQLLIILITLIFDFVKKTERWNSDLTLLIIYVIFAAIAVVGQLLGISGDIPVAWLAACFFLMISVTVIKVKTASEQLKSVTETEKIGKLAFEDGLTGVGNTAAFRKRLSHLEVVKINYKTIGIIQFDINNLKTINDTLGHEMGDKLITDGSSMISDIFGKIGDVYRTGGDEFVAIVCGDTAPTLCTSAINEFERAMDEYNSDTTHKFKLQVAYGVEYYRSDSDKRFATLRQIQKIADEKMYNKKREMKAAMNQTSPENVVIR